MPSSIRAASCAMSAGVALGDVTATVSNTYCSGLTGSSMLPQVEETVFAPRDEVGESWPLVNP